MKRSLSSQAALALVCQFALLASGCIVTDTGNPFDEPGDGEDPEQNEGTAGGVCDEVATEVELDEVTALGFSARAISALLPSEQKYQLEWRPQEGLQYGPESGTVELTLRVVPLGGARLVDRSPSSSGGGGLLVESADGCGDSLELDVRVQLETSGGALLESIDTQVEAYAADFASGGFNLDLDEVAGSFEAQVQTPPNMQLTRASVQGQLGFSEYGAVGNLRLFTEFKSSDGGAVGQASGGVGDLAHFPAENYCGSPNAVSVFADQAVRGMSLSSVLSALNAQSPASVSYLSGASSELELTFSSDADRVCITFDRDPNFNGELGGAVLNVGGTVQLHSADGRLDGEFPVDLNAQTSGGQLQVSASATQYSQEPARAAQLASEYGVQDDVNVSTYDGASLRFNSHSFESDSSGGSLAISGLQVPECLSNPPPVDPNANGADGCRGIDEVPLWRASWGDDN